MNRYNVSSHLRRELAADRMGVWRPNASIVMADFLYVAPGRMRFNGPERGAWYAADDIRTAAAGVGHHLRREAVARSLSTMTRTYRAYAAMLSGDYLDIRGQQTTRADVYARL